MIKYCGAKNRAGNPCKRPVGWGTHHPGQGRCKLHGGSSHGAPLSNMNAVKTHEYETINIDKLDVDARKYLDSLQASDDQSPVARCKAMLTDTCLRLFLMHEQLKTLTQRDNEMTLVEEIIADLAGDIYKRKPVANTILALNNSITRLQSVQTRQLNTLMKALQAEGDKSSESNGLELLTAINESIAETVNIH